MPGTREGGQKSRDTNKRKHGQDFYQVIGKTGGRKSRGGGFAEGSLGRERARIWGAIGGAMSRRGDYKLSDEEKLHIKKQIVASQYEKLQRTSESNSELKKKLLAQKKEFQRRSRQQVNRLSEKYGVSRSW